MAQIKKVGHVFVLLLGHDAQSFQTSELQTIVLNGVGWAAAPTSLKA
jgi:type 1 glutamine amidotransferase